MKKYSILKAGALAVAGGAGFWLGEMHGATTAMDQASAPSKKLITVIGSDGNEMASVPRALSEEGTTYVCVPSELPAYDVSCGSKEFGSPDQREIFRAMRAFERRYSKTPYP